MQVRDTVIPAIIHTAQVLLFYVKASGENKSYKSFFFLFIIKYLKIKY